MISKLLLTRSPKLLTLYAPVAFHLISSRTGGTRHIRSTSVAHDSSALLKSPEPTPAENGRAAVLELMQFRSSVVRSHTFAMSPAFLYFLLRSEDFILVVIFLSLIHPSPRTAISYRRIFESQSF